jgi:hypothetical protein
MSVLKTIYFILIIISVPMGNGAFAQSGTLITQNISDFTFSSSELYLPRANAVVSASASSGLAVSFSSATPDICSISNNDLTAFAAGTCIVAADQVGSAEYAVAPRVTKSITVNKSSPLFSLQGPSALVIGKSTVIYVLGRYGSIQGYSSITPQVCNVSGFTVTGMGNGVCTIQVDLLGDSNFNSAQATYTFTVSGFDIVSGWNLLGNSINTPISAAATFVSNSGVVSVWKWMSTGTSPGITYPTWAFYTPSLAPDALAQYAASKGYDVLTAINGGEGFWVKAEVPLTLELPQGTSITSTAFADQATGSNNLQPGWSLIATGDNPSAKVFANRIAVTPPASGTAATSLTTLWAWDSKSANWYFYAPSLDNAGTLLSYISGMNYLDFSGTATTSAKTLDPITGFWVNHP